MKFKLLALDLDGTLTNSRKEVSNENKIAIKKAIDNGVKIVLASGRPVIGMQKVAEELELVKYGGYILAYNGGHIIECKSGKTIIKETIPFEYYHDICECGKKFGAHTLTYNEKGIIAENDESSYVRKEAYNNSILITKVNNLESVIKEAIVKFMIVGDPLKLKETYYYIQDLFKNKLNVFFSEPYFLEITPLGVEKAASLAKLLKYLTIDREELIACGDGLNDISMLKYAGFAVAMGNAYKETKECADYIVATNEKNGVAEAIEKFIL
ncbi:Cof-type HAD-IIB family hydrolase [Murimonas intestini]|uniref:HAD family phosphatase n=1 Tax=Murimonas intestini TaxID=1337051 RepID=A0AB73T9D8_9FIRM|nr:Cof-type HAD-IIB family hydrolase [Murimonas intestini]MCR1839498.1 Cof-type HAD-IIB family hydrolase [Murimonas intestini]MCR1867960.1 Cof-type HAD-IIB family hydrolase [Murimonas intestini]MCR1882402.1 Cof-type HAD-IIB family hydrolase [Murimonas intestini]